MHAAVKGGEGFRRGIHAGGLRVVEELDLADFAYEFQAMLDPTEASDGLAQGVEVRADGRRRRRGRRDVFDVVSATQRDLGSLEKTPLEVSHAVAELALRNKYAIGEVLPPAEEDLARSYGGRKAHHVFIVGVYHRDVIR